MQETQTTARAIRIDPVDVHIRLLKQALRDRESKELVCSRCKILLEIGFSQSEIRRIMTRFIKQRIRMLVYRDDYATLYETVKHALQLHFPEDLLTRAVEHSVAKSSGKSIIPAKLASEYFQ